MQKSSVINQKKILLENTMPTKTVIFQRGEYMKPMGFWWVIFQRGEYTKPMGFGMFFFYCF